MAQLDNPSPLKRFILKCVAPMERTFGFRFYFLSCHDYYWAIPPMEQLKDRIWEKPSSLVGVNMNEQGQLDRLKDYQNRFATEYNSLPQHASADPTQYYLENRTYGSVDGVMLYCFVRDIKPRRIIEVGSGMSTRASALALRKNAEEGRPGELTAIEPYPDNVIAGGFPGLTRLIRKGVQDVPLSTFESLEAGDIFFIDSSHVLNIGGDVQYEFLEILPRLKPGVIVHVHDIFFPLEYPRNLVRAGRFWGEQYLLQAFLMFNDSFEVLFASHLMHVRHPEALSAAISVYNPRYSSPGSFWMRRTR